MLVLVLSPGQSSTTQNKSPGIVHSEISQALKMHAGVDFQHSLKMPRGLQDYFSPEWQGSPNSGVSVMARSYHRVVGVLQLPRVLP